MLKLNSSHKKISVFLVISILLLSFFSMFAITPTVKAQQTTGDLYIWIQHWFDFNNPETDTQASRLASAGDALFASGITIWLDVGNWDTAHLTTNLINYFHAHHIKVMDVLHSYYTETPLNTMLHSMDPANGVAGSVDYQMSIGSNIDGFRIDECLSTSSAYYQTLADYIHGLGKLMFVNPGGHNIDPDMYDIADKVSSEFVWYTYATSANYEALRASHPDSMIGVSKDWGYAHENNALMMPLTADSNLGRPAIAYHAYDQDEQHTTQHPNLEPHIEYERALYETLFAWNNGVSLFSAFDSDSSQLPLWWETYVDALGGSSTNTFGNANIGAIYNSGISTDKLANLFYMPSSGNITSISWYGCLDTTANMKFAVYSDVAGVPSVLLGTTQAVSVGTSFAWNTATFSTPLNSFIGNKWLALVADNEVAYALYYYYDVGTNTQRARLITTTYSGEFTNPFGTVDSYSSHTLSLYATYTIDQVIPDPTATPTATPTPTATTTATATPTPTVSAFALNLQAIIILLALIMLIVFMVYLMLNAVKNHNIDNLVVSVITFILIIVCIYVMIQVGIL